MSTFRFFNKTLIGGSSHWHVIKVKVLILSYLDNFVSILINKTRNLVYQLIQLKQVLFCSEMNMPVKLLRGVPYFPHASRLTGVSESSGVNPLISQPQVGPILKKV